MTDLSRRVLRTDDHPVEITGRKIFKEHEWRVAIRRFIEGIGRNTKKGVLPTIRFGPITLRLNPNTKTYYAYGVSYEQVSIKESDSPLVVEAGQLEVQNALDCFVKDETIKILTIVFSGTQRLYLWKKPKREQYGCSSYGLTKVEPFN